MPVIRHPAPSRTANGFFAVFVLFVWGFIYAWLFAAGVHHALGLDALEGGVATAAYALHAVPVLALPILIFKLALRREAARQVQAQPASRASHAGWSPSVTPTNETFARLKLKTFVCKGLGVMLQAPESWVQTGDQAVLRVVDPKTGTEISASAYANAGLSLEECATFRFLLVKETMPFLRRTRAPYPIASDDGWQGLAGEFEGLFPGETETRHVLVLCICADQTIYSITVTALLAVFEQRQRFYKWLLQTKLEIFSDAKV